MHSLSNNTHLISNFRCKKVIAWQPVLTDHQAFTYQELGKLTGELFVVYVTSKEHSIRYRQGWRNKQIDGLNRQYIPKLGFFRYCLNVLINNKDKVHIFGSPFESKRIMICMLLASIMRIEFYLLSEPYSPSSYGYFSSSRSYLDNLKKIFRPLLYKVYFLFLVKNAYGIFTISDLAMQQFLKLGVSKKKLFPFGYFVPKASPLNLKSNPRKSKNLKIIFIGAIIPRKGLHTLVSVIRKMQSDGYMIELDVYGSGVLDIFCDQVSHKGQITFGESQSFISEYDLLVLPSYYDGWGVVVNESICAGVPVVCSDQVGARVLVENFGVGKVFTHKNLNSLRAILTDVINNRNLLRDMGALCGLASDAIQPSVAAAYMFNVIQAPIDNKPLVKSPWYENNY